MKNIHVLPTEKGTGRLAKSPNTKYYVVSDHNRGISDHIDYNIYITSDEEIKEGDWCYQTELPNLLEKCKSKEENWITNRGFKKIILTTDQDLIKDGVQAIDDEFLEWFVKNPSCEEVKTNYIQEPCLNCEWNYDSCPNSEECLKSKYKIIIPKEKPKQDCECTDECLGYLTKDCKGIEQPKQETTSEGFHRISKEIDYSEFDFVSFKIGIEWQQEQDKNKYSEEEVLEILNHHTSYLESFIYQYIDKDDMEENEEWFEQFKKK